MFSMSIQDIHKLDKHVWKVTTNDAAVFIVKSRKKSTITQKEYNNLLALKYVDGVPRIFNYYHNGIPLSSYPCLVLYYTPGEDLFNLIDSRILTPTTIIPIFRSIVKILANVHTLGIYHRDIKPENIIVSFDTLNNPKVTVIDWEYAESITKHITIACGTRTYISPEMVQQPRVFSICNDVWALGVVLYMMLTNTFPFPDMDTFVYLLSYNPSYDRQELTSESIVFLKKIFTPFSQRLTLSEALLDTFLAE